MPSSFRAYIDESGCEGWEFAGGSSDWFVLSAVVVPVSSLILVRNAIHEARAAFGNKQNAFHFSTMPLRSQRRFLGIVCGHDFATITAAFHKQDMNALRFRRHGPDDRTYRLYFYAVKLLLEKVCWYCKNHPVASGDGTIELVFSQRTMSYGFLRWYLRLVETNPTKHPCSIDWAIVRPDQIISRPHEQNYGLQVVDAVASSYWYAFETKHKNHTHEHAQVLLPKAFTPPSGVIGAGVKIFPKAAVTRIQSLPDYGWLK